jgi:thiol-disulfide isomerase/thioredoxin
MRLIMTFLLAVFAAGAATGIAADAPAYNESQFKAAQARDSHIVVEVFKKGCPTCAAQQPSLDEARALYPNAVFLRVDFEHDTHAVETFRAVKQSTIIVFRGENEVARLVGETDRDAVIGAIAKGA